MVKPAVYIDGNRCKICRRCLAQQVCKVRAIVRFDREEPPVVDVHRCHGCLICLTECPFGVIAPHPPQF